MKLPILLLLLAAGAAGAATDAEVESALHVAAARLNRHNPRQLDSVTRLDTVLAGPGRRLTYMMTVLKPLTTTPRSFGHMMRAQSLAGLCTDPAMRPFLEDSVVMATTYRDVEGRFIAGHELGAKDCSGLAR